MFPISEVPSAAKSGDEHRHPGADVRALDAFAVKTARTADDRPVGVAQRDPSAHRDELVDEEEAVLEHLLEDQDLAVRLGGEGEGDRGKVGREGGPGPVLDLRDGAAEVGLDLSGAGPADDHVVAVHL